ncbi:MAG TPA: MFS transporter [Caulobacteraceae bacterium]
MTADTLGPPRKSLPLSVALPFSLPALPLTALGFAMFISLAPYFASHLGVSLATVGLAFTIVRFCDMGVDVGLGAVMDRTRSPLGRYRLWMMIGAPVMMLGCYQLFMAPVGIGLWYLVPWLLVLYFGWSILNLAHPAWGATLATHYDARSRLFGVLSAVGVLGACAVVLIPIVGSKLGLKNGQAVPAMGWFIIVALPITVAIAAARTRETIAVDVKAQKLRLRDYLELIIKPDLMRLVLAQTCLTLGPGWMSALYLFYFKDGRGFDEPHAYGLLFIYIVAGVCGAPTTAWLATRFNKHRALMAATTAYSLGLCTVVFLPRGNLLATIPVMFWCGFMASGFDLMIRAMLADVGDEVRLEKGRERISLIYAMNGLAAKVAAAVQLAITYPLLQQLGYKAKEGVANTPQAIHNLEISFIVGPIIFVMLGGACVIGWRLDARKHAHIRRQLEERDALYDETPVVETLTGHAGHVVLAKAD